MRTVFIHGFSVHQVQCLPAYDDQAEDGRIGSCQMRILPVTTAEASVGILQWSECVNNAASMVSTITLMCA